MCTSSHEEMVTLRSDFFRNTRHHVDVCVWYCCELSEKRDEFVVVMV